MDRWLAFFDIDGKSNVPDMTKMMPREAIRLAQNHTQCEIYVNDKSLDPDMPVIGFYFEAGEFQASPILGEFHPTTQAWESAVAGQKNKPIDPKFWINFLHAVIKTPCKCPIKSLIQGDHLPDCGWTK